MPSAAKSCPWTLWAGDPGGLPRGVVEVRRLPAFACHGRGTPHAVRDDLEQNFRAVLRASLAKLDLVTRDEFEVQESVLARTREKLEALEARLEELEKG